MLPAPARALGGIAAGATAVLVAQSSAWRLLVWSAAAAVGQLVADLRPPAPPPLKQLPNGTIPV